MGSALDIEEMPNTSNLVYPTPTTAIRLGCTNLAELVVRGVGVQQPGE